MYDFIVLGIIPGTQIQINFDNWLHFAGSLCLLLIISNMQRRHLPRNLLIALAFAAATSKRIKT